MFSDFHAHLDGYEPGKLKEVLYRARADNVEIILACGITTESSQETINIAQNQPAMVVAVGIHPWNAISPSEEVMKRLGELATQKKVAAIGEVGLDYARSPETKEIQKELFRLQVYLAREKDLPLNVHCKDAHKDIMSILRQMKDSRLRGAAHGFAGDRAALMDWLDLGFFISIGVRSFTRSDTPDFREAVKLIPRDRLLIETDSSVKSLASGEMVGPASAIFAAEKLALLLGTTAQEIGSTATANLKRLLAINSQPFSSKLPK